MQDPDKLREHVAQLGNRYLHRTLGDVRRIHELAAQLRGEADVLQDLERIAHKIHGSGAMFGFHGMSDCAGDIERTAVFLARREGPAELHAMTEQQLLERLASAVANLEAATRAAAQQRGVDVNDR